MEKQEKFGFSKQISQLATHQFTSDHHGDIYRIRIGMETETKI